MDERELIFSSPTVHRISEVLNKLSSKECLEGSGNVLVFFSLHLFTVRQLCIKILFCLSFGRSVLLLNM